MEEHLLCCDVRTSPNRLAAEDVRCQREASRTSFVLATGDSRWWPWERTALSPLPFRSCRIVTWWTGNQQAMCAASRDSQSLRQLSR